MTNLLQPVLLDVAPRAEQLSAPDREKLWGTLEDLCHRDGEARREALHALGAWGQLPASMLVLHQLLFVLRDSELENRQLALQLIATLIDRSDLDIQSQLAIRQAVGSWLKKTSENELGFLLECSGVKKELRGDVGRLLNLNAPVRLLLEEYCAARSNELKLRQEAVYFIGQLGFEDSLPVLRKLLQRLETRQQGQRVMPFAPPATEDDSALLPELRWAISRLEDSG